MDWEKFLTRMIQAVILVVVIAGLSFAGYATVASVRANGQVDYCYTTWAGNYGPIKGYWILYGHRPWRSDESFGQFMTLEEVQATAKAHNCQLNVKQ